MDRQGRVEEVEGLGHVAGIIWRSVVRAEVEAKADRRSPGKHVARCLVRHHGAFPAPRLEPTNTGFNDSIRPPPQIRIAQYSYTDIEMDRAHTSCTLTLTHCIYRAPSQIPQQCPKLKLRANTVDILPYTSADRKSVV